MNFRFKLNEDFDDYDDDEDYARIDWEDKHFGDFDPWDYIDEDEAVSYLIDTLGKDKIIDTLSDEFEKIPEWGDEDYDQDDIFQDVLWDNLHEFESELGELISEAKQRYLDDAEDIKYMNWEYERSRL